LRHCFQDKRLTPLPVNLRDIGAGTIDDRILNSIDSLSPQLKPDVFAEWGPPAAPHQVDTVSNLIPIIDLPYIVNQSLVRSWMLKDPCTFLFQLHDLGKMSRNLLAEETKGWNAAFFHKYVCVGAKSALNYWYQTVKHGFTQDVFSDDDWDDYKTAMDEKLEDPDTVAYIEKYRASVEELVEWMMAMSLQKERRKVGGSYADVPGCVDAFGFLVHSGRLLRL